MRPDARIPVLRTLVLLVVLSVGLYGALCAWLYFAQRSLVYFPQYTRTAPASTDFALRRGDVTLRGWRLNPGGRDPIIYLGGNAERIEANRDALVRMFPERAIYLLAYRGYGASDGAPSSTLLKADAVALFDHVRAAHPAQPISVIGRSLGSGVASHVAGLRPVHRLALVTPFDNLRAVAASHYRFVPVRWLMREEFDSVAALRDAGMPVLIVRAGRDTVVPAERTRALLASLPHAREVVIDDATHDSISGDPGYDAALREFFGTGVTDGASTEP